MDQIIYMLKEKKKKGKFCTNTSGPLIDSNPSNLGQERMCLYGEPLSTFAT